MRVVLSYPFAGAVYWWFAHQNPRLSVDMRSQRPRHGYYRALYANPERNIDVALSCLVIFDEVLLPGGDVWFPGTRGSAEEPLQLPELGIELHIGPFERAREILEHRVDDVLVDPVIARSVTGSDWAKQLQLLYAIVDCLLSSGHMAPVICSDRRRRVVRRLLELGLLDKDLDPSTSDRMTRLGGEGTDLQLASYTKVVGLTFAADNIRTLAELKHHDKIRSHALDFAIRLTTSGAETDDEDAVARMYEHIADAWNSADLAAHVAGTFTAASRTFDVASVIPGVGTVAAGLGVGADAVAAGAERQSERLKWYELGPEIARQRSLQRLEAELKRRHKR